MRGATCFSGIGAPEMGLPECDWVWHAEIEPFPSAVMAARHPESVNLGDVLAADFIERARAMGPLDIMAGGPPCQGFSIAGLRGGLSDPRGNLTLRWVQILHAIQPRNAITENVPGWLSMPDNAFGCFLAGLVGADDALSCPTGGSWPGEGMVEGPRARAAWRILDAQYFGVAQRRRRVFVVADFGNGADPAEILFERASGEGNFAPRREAGKGTAADVAPSLVSSGRGVERCGETRGQDHVVAVHCADISPTLNAHFGDKQGLEDQHINGGGDCSLPSVAMCLNAGAMGRQDAESETLIPTNRCGFDVAHSLRAEGFDASEDGTGRGTPIVPVQEPIVIMERGREGGSNLEHRQDGTANAILTPNGGRGGMGVGAIAYRNTGNCGAWETGDKVDTLTQSTDPNAHILAHAIQAGALRENPNSGPDGVGVQSDLAYTLEARAEVQAVAWSIMPQNSGKDYKARSVDIAQPLMAGGPVGGNQGGDYVQDAWAVRRLTATECARLQGFPDNYPRITYRGKIAADGPIYKALGNSWAVPCGAWILKRTASALASTNSPDAMERNG